MRVLFDKSAPNGLIRHLEGHAVSTAEELGWGRLQNGDLLEAAEKAGSELFLTADKNLRYQQNLAGRTIVLIVLGHSPLAACAIAHSRDRSGRECSRARQLRRSRHPAAAKETLPKILGAS